MGFPPVAVQHALIAANGDTSRALDALLKGGGDLSGPSEPDSADTAVVVPPAALPLEAAFKISDTNGDGGVSLPELRGMQFQGGLSMEQFRAADLDGDGILTLDELQVYCLLQESTV